jgi:AcrR family transcriptional regulator
MVEGRNSSGVWERKRIRTALEIECVALGLLSERGLDTVTVEQIAVSADISTRTFFRYFRNVRDVLSRVPLRESERVGAALMARPPEEDLLDALRALYTYDEADAAAMNTENGELERQAVELWGRIVRAAPDATLAESHATAILASRLEAAIRLRVQLGADDADAAGVVSAALAAVIWSVYVRSLERGATSSLAGQLTRAFETLGSLLGGLDRAEPAVIR